MEKLESFTFPRWFTRCGIDSLTGTHLIDLNSFFLFFFLLSVSSPVVDD